LPFSVVPQPRLGRKPAS